MTTDYTRLCTEELGYFLGEARRQMEEACRNKMTTPIPYAEWIAKKEKEVGEIIVEMERRDAALARVAELEAYITAMRASMLGIGIQVMDWDGRPSATSSKVVKP